MLVKKISNALRWKYYATNIVNFLANLFVTEL